ncbi:hypothetical protein AXK11_01025 [Cephaloticoccus primus]|uniref:Porin n=1 Tax=Cephaloticoccus primus TaxID=1548207 RepID=A0A139SUE1_9BACT|nr:porin [Cephaloticoccus primus]KXU38209.1 hypothetical protein AXK11_01025 [Cephaloticoccus primus]
MKYPSFFPNLRTAALAGAVLASTFGGSAARAADGDATPAAATSSAVPDNAQLLRLIEAQARQIEQLEARLAALAERGAEATPRAPTTAGAAAPAATKILYPSEVSNRVEALEKQAAGQPKINWSRGAAPQFTSADGSLSFRPRGRVLIDFSGTGGSRFGGLNNSGTEVRSLRLGFEGKYNQIRWELEGDFADNTTAWKGAYVAFGHKLFGNSADLTVGNRLHDLGIDGASGMPSVPFQDRNVVALALQPASGTFGVGITERVGGDNWHASLGVTGNDLSNPGDNNDTLTYRARAHYNPVKGKNGTVHLGAWGTYEDFAPGQGSIVRNWAIGGHFNDNVKTRAGALAGATSASAYGVELGGFRGPFWAYGEYGRREVKSAVGARDYDAYAVSAGWFLSGATPAYNASTGTWGGAKVAHPVTSGGAGAWELKARYESLDYGKLPGGGEGDAWTVGVNWYLNNYSRVLFDAVLWDTDNRSGSYLGADDGYTINTRLQLTF